MEIAELQSLCHRQATKTGFNDKVIPIPEMIALIHSEASEALEEFRNDKPLYYTGENGKPEGISAEFADIVIRVAHYCEILGIDLNHSIETKMDFNATRPYRHGNKKA